MGDLVIDVSGLRKVYRIGEEKVVALDHVDLQVERGTICCLLGTSGSGKSTLLNMLAGLEKPTKGTITIDGNRIDQMSEKALAKYRQGNVGFVFQSYNLIPSMTALENVALPLTFEGMARKKRIKIAKDILTSMGLGDHMNHKPTQLSGGQQQRVGIARAFVASPKIVYADEPTGNLDSKTTSEIMELIVRETRKNHGTMVLVTHDQDLAKYADQIYHVLDGNILSVEKNDHPQEQPAQVQ
jgi:putative ABC transport system ATP-binding protein